MGNMGGAQGATGVTGRGLYPDIVEALVAQQFAVCDAVKRDATGQT